MATIATRFPALSAYSGLRPRLIGLYGILICFNVGAWILLFIVGTSYPALIGTGVLAYTLGLSHAVDADHIAAIDNSTRKLMQDGQRPVAVGFFFSLGHSTVVIALSILIAISIAVVGQINAWAEVGGLIGTFVSGAFLLVIGLINLVALTEIYRMFRRVTSGGEYHDQSLDEYMANRGILARIFRPMLRLVRKSWQMYPIGLLFGLGFDTASQVGLLGVSATASGQGIPIVAILILPLLFTAGMSLVDSTDGVMMLGAYGWAFLKPIRKLYYNMTITAISVVIALFIGSIELLSIVADHFQLTGGIWDWIEGIDFGTLGFAIIALFIVAWIGSAAYYRIRGYDKLEVNSAPAPAQPSSQP